ncbi:MAG TPA: type II secretion system protein [Clostridia bacterium]|nr:type II secretion system protein [Clostridia bacterium]
MTTQFSSSRQTKAFTLIELLVVIAVIALLAALIFPVTGAVNKAKIRSRTKAELQQIQTAIESYKAKMGHYPPSDTNSLVPNALFYELVGTTMVKTPEGDAYVTTDQTTTNLATHLPTIFGPRIGGIMNCTRGGDDEGQTASKFLANLKPGVYLQVTTNSHTFTLLGAAVDGPLIYQSERVAKTKINPWRYNAARPVHNSGAFDLFIDVKIGNQIYRINNWGKEFVVQPPYNYWP